VPKEFIRHGRKLSPQEKEELVSKIEQDARHNEVNYYGCAQSVLGALQVNLNIGNVDVFRAACPLSGGVGGMGEVCGAVAGGIIAIGTVYGREQFNEKLNAHNDPAVAESRRRARHFLLNFRNEYGYLTCRDIRYQVRGIPPFAQLLPPDPAPEDWARVDEMYPNHYKCGEVCARAARLAAETILEPRIVLQ
jgi:C_GCAxxG_C_C family probable redox protein